MTRIKVNDWRSASYPAVSNMFKALLGSALGVCLSSTAVAQQDVWSGLARTQFDSDDLTLRIPCAILEDGNGASIPGFTPAYRLNLLFEESSERFLLVEPIEPLDEIPESCLDTLTVDGNAATYRTTSAEVDSDAAVSADRFYTLELTADLGQGGAVYFDVSQAESRLYQRPSYQGNTNLWLVGPAPFTSDFIFDKSLLDEAVFVVNQDLVVFEPGRVRVSCDYADPQNLLEVVEVIGDNTRYRLRSTLTSLDNDKEFTLTCTVFNLDINRLESSIAILTWIVSL